MAITKLGKNIKELLYIRRMSQIELAAKVGVHKQMLSKWIRGERNPKHENLERVAKALDTTVENLLKEQETNLVPTPQQAADNKIKDLEEKLKFKDEQLKHFKERIKFLEDKVKFLETAKNN